MTHGLIAALTNEGHWQLTDTDARNYAQAVKNVARHYSIGATQKALDFYALAMIMANVEGSRVFLSYRNRRAQRARDREPPQPQSATIFEFRQPGPQPAPAAAPADQQQQRNGESVEGFTGDGVDSPIGGH